MSDTQPSVVQHIARFVDRNASAVDQQDAIQCIVHDIKARQGSLEGLIEHLGSYLTADVKFDRGQAAQLLGEVVKQSPAALQNQAIQSHLVTFLASRSTDRPSVCGCLQAFNGLLQLQTSELQAESTTAIANALLAIDVPDLGQADRMLALTVLLQLMQKCGAQLVRQGVDLLQGTIAAIDGEKDPRCLLLSFQCSQQIVFTYDIVSHQVQSAQASLAANVEELFDVVSCYFPISFSPPPNNVHGITRQDLADALQATLTCTPRFAPLFVPVLVEKLSSTLRQAKLDALAALPAAALGYGAVAIQPHLSLLWRTLKPALLGPAAASALSDEQITEVASKGRDSLTKLVAALSEQGNSALPELVLADAQVAGDMLGCLSGYKQQGSQSPAQQVKTLAEILAAAAQGSSAACELTFKKVMPQLIPVLSPTQTPSPGPAGTDLQESTALALRAALTLLKAVHKLVATGKCPQDPLAGNGLPLLAAVTVTSSDFSAQAVTGNSPQPKLVIAQVEENAQDQSLMQLATGTAAATDGSNQTDVQQASTNAIKLVQLEVLTELVSIPAGLVFGAQDLGNAVTTCLHCLTQGHPEVEAQQAIAALSSMADAGYADLLQETALEHLLAAATEVTGQEGQWQGALPLAALTALCKQESTLGNAILGNMRQLLPTLLAASVDSTGHQQMLIGVLGMIRDKLPMTGRDGVLAHEFALQLLTGILQLTKAGKAATVAVASACAQALQVATSSCGPDQQPDLSTLAFDQLQECCSQLKHAQQHSHKQAPTSVAAPQLNKSLQNLAQQSVPTQMQAAETAAHEQRQQQPNQHDQQQQHHLQHQQQRQQQVSQLASLHPKQLQLQLVAQSSLAASATVAGLWPEALPQPQAAHVLQSLVLLARGLYQQEAQQAAMVATAAVLNKWSSDEASMQGAISDLLSALYLGSPSEAPSTVSQQLPPPQSFICLAWTVKGLCMAGNKAGFDLAILPVHYLTHPQPSTCDSSHAHQHTHSRHAHGNSHSVRTQPPDETSIQPSSKGQASVIGHSGADSMQAAAAVYALVPSTPASILSLGKESAHVRQKPLWQQRFFTQVLQQLEKNLTLSTLAPQALTAAGAGQEQQQQPANAQQNSASAQHQHETQQDSSAVAQHERLLLALANLVQGTPAHIVKTELPRLVGWLLQALNVLQRPAHSRDPALLLTVLNAVDNVLQDAAGRASLEGEVSQILAMLVKLLSFSGAAEVRIVSMQCLKTMLKMPYHLLHPHRKEVVAALALAVDDNKRRVRQEAVKCRKAWVTG